MNMTGQLERLAAAGIDLVPLDGVARHYVFTRDGFVALVERLPDNGFGRAGASGLLTEKGFAALVWRGGRAWFTGRGYEREALPGEVDGLRAFAADLDAALGRPANS